VPKNLNISILENKIFAYPRFLDLTLERIQSVLHNLGDPHLKLPPVIHVAGTNGKGSTIAFLYAILRAHGFKVHVFTSPHLIKLNERIVIANQEIDDLYFLELLHLYEKTASKTPITWFELLTCVAFLSFSQTKADFCLIETGLGGLHDATNIIENPILSLITSISYDHQDILGKTLKEIAFQKAGILKKSATNLIGQNIPKILDFYRDYMVKNELEGGILNDDYNFQSFDKGFRFRSNDVEMIIPTLGLQGQHQLANASLAIMASLALKEKNYDIQNDIIVEAIKNTKWPGRLHQISTLKSGVEIWVDGAHNQGGIRALLETLEEWLPKFKLHIVLCLSKTKDPILFLESFKDKNLNLYAYQNPCDDFIPSSALIDVSSKMGIKMKEIHDLDVFLEDFNEGLCLNTKIIFTGSLHFVGQIMKR
jgi:dihydrofolate synthase / folylpolyglutamate synthase